MALNHYRPGIPYTGINVPNDYTSMSAYNCKEVTGIQPTKYENHGGWRKPAPANLPPEAACIWLVVADMPLMVAAVGEGEVDVEGVSIV